MPYGGGILANKAIAFLSLENSINAGLVLRVVFFAYTLLMS